MVEVNRRTFLWGSVAVALGACGRKGRSGGGATSGPTPPSPRRAPSPIGYSHVMRLDGPNAAQVSAAGLTLVHAEPFNHDTLIGLPQVRAAADVMRAAGGTTLVTVVNVNARNATEWTDADFDAAVRQVIDVVGPSNVWLEAVSNGEANYRGWQDRAKTMWPGEVVFSLHPCDLDQARSLLSPARVVVSDCTPILASTVSEADVKDVTRLALERRAIWLWYDTVPSVPWNPHVVRWMGEEVQTHAAATAMGPSS